MIFTNDYYTGCTVNCDNPPDVTVAVEDGGSECDSTIWVEVTPAEQAYEERTCVDAVKPVNAVRTVTLEFIKGPVTCDNCAFGGPYIEGCAALQNGEPSLDCHSEGYFRVKAGA